MNRPELRRVRIQSGIVKEDDGDIHWFRMHAFTDERQLHWAELLSSKTRYLDLLC